MPPNHDDLLGPDGQDWRVPVCELKQRLEKLRNQLTQSGISGVIIQHPVDLYYHAGTRQEGFMYVPEQASEAEPVLFIRKSFWRACWETGGDDAPFRVEKQPRFGQLAEVLNGVGCQEMPAFQLSKVPYSTVERFSGKLSDFGTTPFKDATNVLHQIRESKSEWEIERMREGAAIQKLMFEAVRDKGSEGMTELELTAVSEEVSRAEGFGSQVRMRRFPLECDRGVVVAGRSGGVPAFFDAAIGGSGPHPLVGMGSGFNRIGRREPVSVDLVHVHRGYVVDATRMFCAGKLSEEWIKRLNDTIEIRDKVVSVLNKGENCSDAWEAGRLLAEEMGHGNHLMGQPPEQARFLGHGIGLELDEGPVAAKGFDVPLPVGGVMAIEPKLVYDDGVVGTEDDWLMTEDGVKPITMHDDFDYLTEW